jgi:hypothetical protein
MAEFSRVCAVFSIGLNERFNFQSTIFVQENQETANYRIWFISHYSLAHLSVHLSAYLSASDEPLSSMKLVNDLSFCWRLLNFEASDIWRLIWTTDQLASDTTDLL